MLVQKSRTFFWVLFFVLIAGAGVSRASAEEAKQVIRVGIFDLDGFQKYNESGSAYGYNIEYLNRIKEETGWEYEYIWAPSWEKALEMLENEEIDLLAPGQRTAEREKNFNFSAYSIGVEYGSILTMKTSKRLIYEDFNSFSGLRFGCVKGVIFEDDFYLYARKNGFFPAITYYEDTAALLSALRIGEVDAVIANLMVMSADMKVLGKFAPSPYYYMMKKGDYLRMEQLDTALSNIKIQDPAFENELTLKYYPSYQKTPFTKNELEYISEAPAFTIGIVPSQAPVSYFDDKEGQICGITKKILDELSFVSGLKFNYVMLPGGDITYDFLRDNNIHIVSGVEYNSLNVGLEGIYLSQPYIRSQKVLVARKGEPFDKNLSVTLALASGSQTIGDIISSQYPMFEIVRYDTVEECMQAVRDGNADVMMQNQYVAEYYLSKPQFENLAIIPVEGIDDELCLSVIANQEGETVSKDILTDKRLLSVINKAINQMGEDKITNIIVSETSNHPYSLTVKDFMYRFRYFIALMTAILMVCFASLFYGYCMRRKTIKEISYSAERLKNITNNINGGVVVLLPNKGLRITYANEGFLELIQYTKEEFEERKEAGYVAYVHPNDYEGLNNLIEADFIGKDKISVQLRIARKDGTYIPTLFNGTLTTTRDGEKELYCVIMDITDQVQIREKLEIEQERYELLIERSQDIIFEYSLENNTLTASSKFQEKFGWTPPGKKEWADFEEDWRIEKKDKEKMQEAVAKLREGADDTDCIVRIMKADCQYVWCQMVFHTLKRRRKPIRIIGRITDIDAQVKEKNDLIQKMQIDALTGLLNKESFNEKAKKYLETHKNETSFVIFCDLDNFKAVNDTLGHIAGDQAIKDAAEILMDIFRSNGIISRFGGDEFCILVKNRNRAFIEETMKHMVERLTKTYEKEDVQVSIGASIGAACAPEDGIVLEELLDKADKALYWVKENGKNQFMFYKRELKLEGYTGRS